MRADLERIHSAGLALQSLLEQVMAQSSGDIDDIDSYRTKLRHDLRTPINAVKGYGEMIIEDARDGGHDAAFPDLEKLLAAADGMLSRIDALVAFSGQTSIDRAADEESFADASRVLDALKSSQAVTAQQAIAGQILVIDDNASNRDLLHAPARARRPCGRGFGVRRGRARACCQSRAFDLILLDVMMPEMSGYEVLSTLKRDPRTVEIPVIMISALDEMDSIVRCIEAGAVDYLPKPFAPALLRARIRASLENKLLRDRERAMMREIRLAKERNEALLLVDPAARAVVDRINDGAAMVADHIPEATIMFADIVNFTPFSGKLSPSDVVGVLNRIFSAFDRLVDQYGAEKIKTIGDGYMVAVGIPGAVRRPRRDRGAAVAERCSKPSTRSAARSTRRSSSASGFIPARRSRA